MGGVRSRREVLHQQEPTENHDCPEGIAEGTNRYCERDWFTARLGQEGPQEIGRRRPPRSPGSWPLCALFATVPLRHAFHVWHCWHDWHYATAHYTGCQRCIVPKVPLVPCDGSTPAKKLMATREAASAARTGGWYVSGQAAFIARVIRPMW